MIIFLQRMQVSSPRGKDEHTHTHTGLKRKGEKGAIGQARVDLVHHGWRFSQDHSVDLPNIVKKKTYYPKILNYPPEIKIITRVDVFHTFNLIM